MPPGDTWQCLQACLVVTTREGGTPGILSGETKDAAKHSAMHRVAPSTLPSPPAENHPPTMSVVPRVWKPLCFDFSLPTFHPCYLGEKDLDSSDVTTFRNLIPVLLFQPRHSVFPPLFQIFAELFFNLIIKSICAACRPWQMVEKLQEPAKEHPSALPPPRGELPCHLACFPPVFLI